MSSCTRSESGLRTRRRMVRPSSWSCRIISRPTKPVPPVMKIFIKKKIGIIESWKDERQPQPSLNYYNVPLSQFPIKFVEFRAHQFDEGRHGAAAEIKCAAGR